MTWFELPLSDFEDNTLNKPFNLNSTLKKFSYPSTKFFVQTNFFSTTYRM